MLLHKTIRKNLSQQRYLSMLIAGGSFRGLDLEIGFSKYSHRDTSTSMKATEIRHEIDGSKVHHGNWTPAMELV